MYKTKAKGTRIPPSPAQLPFSVTGVTGSSYRFKRLIGFAFGTQSTAWFLIPRWLLHLRSLSGNIAPSFRFPFFTFSLHYDAREKAAPPSWNIQSLVPRHIHNATPNFPTSAQLDEGSEEENCPHSLTWKLCWLKQQSSKISTPNHGVRGLLTARRTGSAAGLLALMSYFYFVRPLFLSLAVSIVGSIMIKHSGKQYLCPMERSLFDVGTCRVTKCSKKNE